MNDGEHIHSKSNPSGIHKHKKILLLAIFGILFAIVAYDAAQSASDTASINNVFEIIVNNTNLAPTIEPSVQGTGERLTNVTYYANASPIQLLVFAHASSVSETASLEVFINGTAVLHQQGRPLGGAETAYRSLSIIVPKYASYNVSFSNYHHYEWREYPILSGKNGTLSINQTVVGGTSSLDNASVQINESQVVNLTTDLNSKVNKSGDNMTGDLNVDLKNISANAFLHLDGAPIFPSYTSDWHYFTQSPTNTNAMVMLTASSNFTYSTNFFGGVRARGNLTNPQAINDKDVMFYFYGIGHDGTQYKSSNTNPNIIFRAGGNWNTTSNPTEIAMQVTNINSLTPSYRFILQANGNLTLSKYSQAQKVACFTADGTIYAGTVDINTGNCNPPP